MDIKMLLIANKKQLATISATVEENNISDHVEGFKCCILCTLSDVRLKFKMLRN